MAGYKNFNLTGVSSDIQFGKRGGRLIFDEANNKFDFMLADGTTSAALSMDDLVVNGNLTVLGDTTTISVQTVEIQDNILELNAGETGAGVTSGTSGFEVNRGTEQNAQLVWDESTDSFSFQLADGTPVSVNGDFVVPDSESLYRLSDGKVLFDASGADSATAEYVRMTTEENRVTLGAKNEAGTGDVDLVLTGQGNGTVIFTSESASADGILAAQNGTNLQLSGGDEDAIGDVGDILLSGGDGSTSVGGDVVLSGGANGGTVRIDTTTTTVNDTSSADTVSTVGYVQAKFGEIDTAFIASTDTPEAYGTAGQYVVINGTGDGLVFADLPTTSFSDLTDTPATLGTAGQYVVINGTGDGVEYIDLPTFAMGDLTDTPAAIGTTGQVLAVNATADAFEYVTIDTSFIGADDTPATFGAAGQYVVVNGTGDGLVFADLPEAVSTLEELTDTPTGYGTTGQVLAVNATADGYEHVTLETSFSDLTDTPASLGTAGQYVAVNATGDGVEYVDLPEFSTTIEELTDTPVGYGTAGQALVVNATADAMEYADLVANFTDLGDTPAALGTDGQVLSVTSDGLGLEFTTLPEPIMSITGLTDTPAAFGTPGQVLAVNGTGDGMEFVESRTLSAIEVSDMNSSVATIDATQATYVVIAQPQQFTDSDGTTQSITVNRITLKVSSGISAGEGVRVRVKNDGGAETAVIATADMSDVEEGVYVIDGIFQDVSASPLQLVEAALVDINGTEIASTAGTITAFVEYKTNIS